MFLMNFTSSYRSNPDPALFPDYIRRRRYRIELSIATSQRIFPSDKHHARLRSVHHDHAARKTYVHQSKSSKWKFMTLNHKFDSKQHDVMLGLHRGPADIGIYVRRLDANQILAFCRPHSSRTRS